MRRFPHDRKVLQQLKARGFRPEVLFDIGASTGIWSEAILPIFPTACYHLFEPLASHVGFYRDELDCRLKRFPQFHLHDVALGRENGSARMSVYRDGYGSSMLDFGNRPEVERRVEVACAQLDAFAEAHALPEPQVVKMDTQGAEGAILEGAQRWLRSAQVVCIETWLERCYGPETPLAGEIIEILRKRGFSLVEFGDYYYDAQHRLYSVDAFFVAEGMLKKPLGLSSLARRLETLTGRESSAGEVALHDADAIVSHIEVNRKHGVGVLLDRWFGRAPNIVSIRSADQYGGRQDFGTVALRISHPETSPDRVYARVLEAMGANGVGRILAVPYYPDDARTAITLKEISGAPMCTYLMDDSGIPEELMRTLLEKSALRLAISTEIREEFEKKFGLSFAYMPPLAPAQWIATGMRIPEARDEPRGAMVGNIWGARWLELLRKTVASSGVAVDWHASSGFPGDRESLEKDGIHPQPPHDDEALVRALRRSWFAVLPTGTLDARDDRSFIARRSLPSRLIYMMATSLIPVIVLGNRETAAAKFVERHGIGLVADYDRASFRGAVDEVLKHDVNLKMREKALAIAAKYTDAGAAEWIWKSLERGAPADRRFEDL